MRKGKIAEFRHEKEVFDFIHSVEVNGSPYRMCSMAGRATEMLDIIDNAAVFISRSTFMSAIGCQVDFFVN